MNHSTDTRHGHAITIDKVSKVYAGMRRPALDDVSLSIAPGEFMTFLGPSGSGKTTLLSVIAGLTGVDCGSVCVDDRNITALKPHKRDMGVVFQQYALFPHMSVADNIAYPLQQRRMGKREIRERVDAVLRLVHMQELAQRFPRQLSGGQQQRVAIARAVVYQPRALLMDEPLGALDKNLRGELQREIARMHKQLKMTFVFVTHDQSEALSLSDRIAVFNDGSIEQVGTPSELYESPSTLFVAQFLGDSNSFAGVLPSGADFLECGRARLRVAAEQVTSADQRSVVIVRPERVHVYEKHAVVPGGYNQLNATMTGITYAGDHRVIALEFRDGTHGWAKYPAGRPITSTPGEEVVVGWDPLHQSVVPEPAIEELLADTAAALPSQDPHADAFGVHA